MACEPRAARAVRSAAAVVGLLDQLLERALEVLEVQVEVEDLVGADRFRGHGLEGGGRSDGFDLLHRASGDREHDDERDLALGARDLEVEPLLLMAQDLDVAALEAPPAYRAVVEP